MRISTILMAATVALFGLSTASRSDEPDDHFDCAAAKLYSAGYKQVNLVDRNRQLFSAYDGKGSEVMIVVDDTDGNIVTVNYVHGADEYTTSLAKAGFDVLTAGFGTIQLSL